MNDAFLAQNLWRGIRSAKSKAKFAAQNLRLAKSVAQNLQGIMRERKKYFIVVVTK
jgi:hypothetical protein